ncbi:hypothetical protein N9O61_06495 [Octadecabacter sp.]|nr:hypothetical protein [Octadecabacter sp.]
MSDTPMLRLRRAAALAIVTALWCWLLTAAHGIWSLGLERGYLDGGRIPLYPSLPVTYGSFFIDSFSALFITFLFAFGMSAVLPRTYHLPSACIAWGVGAYIGLSGIAFVYQIDFGTTFAPFEATRALILHPFVTPVWLVLGIAGTAFLTVPFRKT